MRGFKGRAEGIRMIRRRKESYKRRGRRWNSDGMENRQRQMEEMGTIERKGNLVENRRVKQESQRMEVEGLRGYYRMKAINECEVTGRWRTVCPCVCFIRVSQSMEPISHRPPSPVRSLKSPCWGFRSLSDRTASLYVSCLTPDQQRQNVLWECTSRVCVSNGF